MPLNLLTKAIKNRNTIRYKYNKTDEPNGERMGHPYAVFIFTSKAGVTSTKVHIVQTSGVSKSGTPFPSFRMYNIEELDSIEILDDVPAFADPLHEHYNPESAMYIDVIVKV
jgi:hypothetical protein